MASLQTRDIRSNLKKKGFDEVSDRDHIWLNYLSPDGKKTPIRTKISHGKSNIGDPLISAMAKQTHLSKKQFVELVSCSLSADEYFGLIESIL